MDGSTVERVLIAGRYRLLELAGRGGMGRVWRARDEVLHREVAVKQITPPSWLTGAERDELRLRTLREARTAACIDHPNVVKVYDVVRMGDSPWIVLEYVPSRTLQDMLDSDGPLPPRRAAAIGLDLLAALHAAHGAGVLHRDVKPANVLVAHDGRALLTDFGLAVFDGGDGAMTRPGMVLGSPQYVAPERATDGVSSVTADLWSLGATLYAAVEGRSPYARSTAMATLSALATHLPDPAPNAGPLAPVLAGLLCRDPDDRTDHAETRRLLTAVLESPGPPVSVPAAPVPEPATTATAATTATTTGTAGGAAGAPGVLPRLWSRGSAARRWALAVSALLVAAVAGVGTALAVTDEPPERPDGARSSGGPAPGGRHGRPGLGLAPGDPRIIGEDGGYDGRLGRTRPPKPGRRGFPPPPFPCLRPDVAGEPVVAASPPAGEPFRPPRGWAWHVDVRGFRVAVPAGWRYSEDGDVACFRDPATGRTLSVANAGDAPAAALDRLRAARQRAIAAGALPGYVEIRLGTTAAAAEWECGWDTPHGLRLRAVQVVPTDAAGGWVLGWITQDADWAAASGQFTTVRGSLGGRPTDRDTAPT
ncbi:serine/threonine-protein kinase [Micromonospora sp. WMMA1363]|uniref:serine/threonine-protein kinase n=1 Tax=Micromonospora sp. WMMA1363 TaxID=3053985 RepID=UPI00259CA525|nr:serine/threonine-protein kinase [Micromonospora sp. WMMA1363]MDM4719759.1 serine/threonine-protein kinase [Micromonospora sp. WMMA1363]